MRSWKSVFGTIAAWIYFLAVMTWLLPMLFLVPIMTLSDMGTVMESGFAVPNTGVFLTALFGLFIGLSLMIPAFRKMYDKLPWMFPYVKIMLINTIIVSVALLILNFGYEVQSDSRHMVWTIVMVVQIILCRILMSLYFHRKRAALTGGMANERTLSARS
ncbi:hypothetical protein NYE70_03250 [Paenibacillus sp. FSL R5-0407]|uniref:hypothetical protein n=1 Tax=Paenibacillus sp. FSL R5-0407 TaxID=2975320 RepID=UPI0030FCF36B